MPTKKKWTDYEYNCAEILARRYEYGNGNIEVVPEGQNNAYKADADILIDGREIFSVEFKAVQKAGDKAVMAPFTMTDIPDKDGHKLLELTDSAYEKINDLEGMLDVACEIQERSDEIIPKEGETVTVDEWIQYKADDDFETYMTADEYDANFKMALCMMSSDFYWKRKNATWFIIGDTPFPFFNDWKHIYEYFDFLIQVRSKGSGGARIPRPALAKLEYELRGRLATDDWYTDDGRVYISDKHRLRDVFGNDVVDWNSESVFSIVDVEGKIRKLNCNTKDGWHYLKPHPTNLTVMPYAVYNGKVPDIDEAWGDLDAYIRLYGGIF